MPFRFNMLLEEAGIAPSDVRLLRHQPKVGSKSLLDVWRTNRPLFESFQSEQDATKRAHLDARYWACFVGTWDGRTVFTGIYGIGAPTLMSEDIVSPISNNLEAAGTVHRYPCERLDCLAAYEGKLYVDWGGGASGKRAWIQRANTQNKVVSELHLASTEMPFPGLMELTQPLSTLSDVPSSWILQLSPAKGVYLLTCPDDGSQYVGSATGNGGFWSRWSEYRRNGHGGNVALKERGPRDYIVSVLQVAGSKDTDDDILASEARWKKKLQARMFGLSRN